MRVINAVRRAGVSVSPDRSVREAAATMEQAGVGSLAVIDGERLVGIVTDRDLVRRAMAPGLAPDARVDGVMTSPPVTIAANAEIHDAFAVFRTHGVRRLAVVRDGLFAGMITVDDLLVDLARDLADLAWPVRAETLSPHHDAGVPATR